MSTEGLHFLSEAKLAQTQRFIEQGTASLARLAVTAPGAVLAPERLRQFAEIAATARLLQAQILADLAPIIAAEGEAEPLRDDPVAHRLVRATRAVADRLDEMITRLDRLQQSGKSPDCTQTSHPA